MATSGSAAAARGVRHLLLRTTYGLTPDLVRTVTPARRAAWLTAQLRPTTLKDPVCEEVLRRFPGWATRSPPCTPRSRRGGSTPGT